MLQQNRGMFTQQPPAGASVSQHKCQGSRNRVICLVLSAKEKNTKAIEKNIEGRLWGLQLLEPLSPVPPSPQFSWWRGGLEHRLSFMQSQVEKPCVCVDAQHGSNRLDLPRQSAQIQAGSQVLTAGFGRRKPRPVAFENGGRRSGMAWVGTQRPYDPPIGGSIIPYEDSLSPLSDMQTTLHF